MPYILGGFNAFISLIFCLNSFGYQLSENENRKRTTIVCFFTNFTKLKIKTIIS